MPWWGYLLATLGPYVLGQLLPGANKPATQTSTTTVPPSGYQSPLTGLADMTIFEQLLGRTKGYQGWGGGPSGGNSAFLDQLMALIGEEGLSLVDLFGKNRSNPYKGGSGGY